MLVHYDRKRPLYIHLDASKARGFGVMIAHMEGDPETTRPSRNKTQPVLFLSKTLSTAERRYWPTELEVACLVWTLKRVRWMVEASDRPVIVLTDHAAITAIAKQTSLGSSSVDKLNNRLTRASQYLSQFSNLRVEHVPGKEHVVPDALSRLLSSNEQPVNDDDDVLDELLLSNQTSMISIDRKFETELKAAYTTDKVWSGVIAKLTDERDNQGFELRDGLLWNVDPRTGAERLCIPKGLEGDVFELVYDN